MTSIDDLLAGEREDLAASLDALAELDWNSPSLCAGWRVHEVASHILMPYEQSVPRFLLSMAAARFRFDTMADRWARRDTRTPDQLAAALRATAQLPFRVPGAPSEAPLSHLVIHAGDIYRALGRPHTPAPEAAAIVLQELTAPRNRRSLVPGLLDGLRLVATDTDWTHGEGPTVTGPASALITTIAGRAAALTDLSGDGVRTLSQRLDGRQAPLGTPSGSPRTADADSPMYL
jgi:uncharacterized protein (TIGR03083 family)